MPAPALPEIEITPGPARPGGSNRVFPRMLAAAVLAALAGLVLWSATTNPRSSVVWSFVAQPGPTVHADSLVAVSAGFALLSRPPEGGVVLWTSSNGLTWSGKEIPGSPSRLLVAGDDLIAFSGYSFTEIGLDGQPLEGPINLPLLVRVGYGSGRAGLAVGPKGMVAQAFNGDVFWSSGAEFERVVASPDWGEAIGMPEASRCRPPTVNSVDLPPLVATPEGFYTLISTAGADPFGIWPVCEPEVWMSSDGQQWRKLTSGSPFGPGSHIYDLAWRDGTLLAVGGFGYDQPAAWTSTDGASWERLAPFPSDHPYQLREVEAGRLGWLVLAERSDHRSGLGWASPDGECWVRLPEQVSGREAAVGEERIVVAEHGSFPVIWVGVPSGGDRLGCD